MMFTVVLVVLLIVCGLALWGTLSENQRLMRRLDDLEERAAAYEAALRIAQHEGFHLDTPIIGRRR